MKKYTVTAPFALGGLLYLENEFLYAEKKFTNSEHLDIYSMKSRKKVGYMKEKDFLNVAKLTES